MARLWMAGAEVDAGAPSVVQASGGLLDGRHIGSNLPIRDTGVFRSGVASWKFDSTGSNLTSIIELTPATYVDGRTYFFRVYVRAAAAPLTTSTAIFVIGNVTGTPAVDLRTDGALELNVVNVVRGSPSAIITDSNWHRVELSATATATGNWGAVELRLDGATVATWSGTQVRGGDLFQMGWIGAPGASRVLNLDDAALNDSTGSVNNSWCDEGAVVVLKPTADSAVGTGWTLGTGTAISGGTGKTAVSNTPPLGVADLTAGSDPKQIRNATSNANSNYDATMTTYTAAGVGAPDVVNAVQCWAATAAPSSTSPKAGTVGIVSNPAVANINLGLPSSPSFYAGGLAAGYASSWKWSPGTMAETPTVTKGTAPVMRITQVTASTRIAMVCGMFVYVDYSPAAAPAGKPRRWPSRAMQAAVMRAAAR